MPATAQRFGAAHVAAVMLVAVLVGMGAGVGLHLVLARSAPAAAVVSTRDGLNGEAVWAAGAHPAPAITTLHDQSGHLFSLTSLHGRSVAIVFFDSHCTVQCPLEGRALAAAERSLPAAQRPVLVAISVNVLDNARSVRRAIRSWGLAGVAPWYWLVGSRRALAPVWKAYRIFVGPAIGGDVVHTEAVYLVDARGDERSAYLYPFAPRFLTSDLRRLAREARS